MTKLPKPKDLTNSYTAKYDAWNRLVSLKAGSNYVQLNVYDGLHRRIMRFTDTDDNGSLDGSKRFYYNEQWQCLEERDYAGSLQRQYVWHPYYIDALAVTYDDQGTKHFYCHDANFNITLALDSSGNPVERYHYAPYGEVTILDANFANPTSSSSIGNEHLYTGRRTDPVTGLQLNRNRYYHAKLGRWLTRDPIGYEGSPYNLYEYVNGMPTYGSDPAGQVCVECTCRRSLNRGRKVIITHPKVNCRGLGERCCRAACRGKGSYVGWKVCGAEDSPVFQCHFGDCEDEAAALAAAISRCSIAAPACIAACQRGREACLICIGLMPVAGPACLQIGELYQAYHECLNRSIR